MISTQEYLAGRGVNMEQAQTFIMENLDNIETIYSVCRDYGVNNDMIADVLQTSFPGLTGNMVSSVFSNNGFDGNALGFNEAAVESGGTLDLANLGNYSAVFLYENVSSDSFEALSGGNQYAYASADTWDGIRGLGFTANYTDLGLVEMSVSNDYSKVAYGMDATSFGPGVIQTLPADVQAELSGVSSDFSYIVGSYDLVIAF
jgi:hypothetical protein